MWTLHICKDNNNSSSSSSSSSSISNIAWFEFSTRVRLLGWMLRYQQGFFEGPWRSDSPKRILWLLLLVCLFVCLFVCLLSSSPFWLLIQLLLANFAYWNVSSLGHTDMSAVWDILTCQQSGTYWHVSSLGHTDRVLTDNWLSSVERKERQIRAGREGRAARKEGIK